MLKLKLQYFDHLMQSANSLEKPLMLRKVESKRKRGWQDEMVGWHDWVNGHEFEQIPEDRKGLESLMCCSPWDRKESDKTSWLSNNKHNSGNTRKGTVTKGGNLVNLNGRKMWKERSFCGNKDDVLFSLPYVLLTFWGKTLCREHLKKSSKNSLNTGNIWFYKTTARRQSFHFQRKPRSTSIPRRTSE